MTTYFRNRRTFLAGVACAAVGTQLRAAQTAPSGTDSAWILAINEAATAAVSVPELLRRYEPLAKVLARAAGRPIQSRPFIDVRIFEEELSKRPNFIFAKTVDILARQVSLNKYVPLAKINKPYLAGIIMSDGTPAKALTDLIGTDVLLPPPDTLTAKLALAAFRDAGIEVAVKDQADVFPTDVRGKVTVRHVQFQEVIPSTVARSFWYKAGAVNPSIIGQWKGKVLVKFKPQPNWSIAALADTPPAIVKAAIAGLTSMHETPEGAAALAAMKIDRFVPGDRAEYVALANYVGK